MRKKELAFLELLNLFNPKIRGRTKTKSHNKCETYFNIVVSEIITYICGNNLSHSRRRQITSITYNVTDYIKLYIITIYFTL